MVGRTAVELENRRWSLRKHECWKRSHSENRATDKQKRISFSKTHDFSSSTLCGGAFGSNLGDRPNKPENVGEKGM